MDISPYADTREGALEEALHSEACAMDGEESIAFAGLPAPASLSFPQVL
jgi:hypothetical protein